MTQIVIQEFSSDEELNYAGLNAVIRRLVGAINSLAGEQVATIGTASADPSTVPTTGGRFAGQIIAPSILIGPTDGPFVPVVQADQAAEQGALGLVYQVGHIAALSQAISDPPSQAEVQALQTANEALRAALIAAGLVAAE